LKVAVLYDVSGSARFHHIPELGRNDLQELLRLTAQRGGAVAFGTIPHPPELPLVVARVPGRPREPRELSARNVFLRMQAAGAYRRRMAQWKEEVAQAERDFLVRAGRLLRPRDAVGSPIFRAIRMAMIFLEEPEPDGPAGERWLVLISDGWDTTAEPPVSALPAGARVALVNGSGSVGNLGHLRPMHFSNIGSAIRFLRGERR
jgi:hypothetical protein